jgi:Domain of unknown function (DUF1902)
LNRGEADSTIQPRAHVRLNERVLPTWSDLGSMPATSTGTEKMARLIVVNATWDPEAGVWVAESDDLPLVTEAPTVDGLLAKLPGMIQDLLEDADSGSEVEIPFQLIAHESVRVRSRAV